MTDQPKIDNKSICLLYGSMLPESTQTLLKRSDLLYTIRHDRLIIYKGLHSKLHGKKRDPLSNQNLKKRKYNGELSSNAIKFVSKQVTLWADAIDNYNSYYKYRASPIKRKLTFATLTLPSTQIHTDQIIKRKLFVPFIDAMRYNFNCENYFWRAETQKNSNIHFHIIFDKFIDIKEIKRIWNQTIEKLGYITEFEKKHNHRNPPTAHIKIIDNTKYSIKYILKYATKESTNRLVTGKIWGMSNSIRCLLVPTFKFTDEILPGLLEQIKNKKAFIYDNDHYVSVSFKNPLYLSTDKSLIADQLKEKLFMIYSFLYYNDLPFNEDPTMMIYEGLDVEELSSITKKLY